MMRLSKVLGSLVAVGAAIVAITATSETRAAGDEDLLTVSCAAGKVSASAKAPWHVNDKAPWRWDKGEKTGFENGADGKPHAAKFSGAKCEGTVKAFICNGDQCKGPIAVAVH